MLLAWGNVGTSQGNCNSIACGMARAGANRQQRGDMPVVTSQNCRSPPVSPLEYPWYVLRTAAAHHIASSIWHLSCGHSPSSHGPWLVYLCPASRTRGHPQSWMHASGFRSLGSRSDHQPWNSMMVSRPPLLPLSMLSAACLLPASGSSLVSSKLSPAGTFGPLLPTPSVCRALEAE